LGHLLVKPYYDRSHFLEYRSGSDQEVCLPGRAPHNLGPEPGNVEARGESGRFFDEAAGKAEEHGPKTVLVRPVDERVQFGED
jgi:hypothetical protein